MKRYITSVCLGVATLAAGCASTDTTIEGHGDNKVDVATAKVDEASVLKINQAIKGGMIANSRDLTTIQPEGDALNIDIPADSIIKACTTSPLSAGLPLKLAIPKTACVQEDVRVYMTNQINARSLRVSKNSTVEITQTNEGTNTNISGSARSQLGDGRQEKCLIKVSTQSNVSAIAVPPGNVLMDPAAAIAAAQANADSQKGMYVIKVSMLDPKTGTEKQAYLNVPQRLLSVFKH